MHLIKISTREQQHGWTRKYIEGEKLNSIFLVQIGENPQYSMFYIKTLVLSSQKVLFENGQLTVLICNKSCVRVTDGYTLEAIL